jgi:hypothetical protein
MLVANRAEEELFRGKHGGGAGAMDDFGEGLAEGGGQISGRGEDGKRHDSACGWLRAASRRIDRRRLLSGDEFHGFLTEINDGIEKYQ